MRAASRADGGPSQPLSDLWCQNLVSNQAVRPYEGQMGAGPFGILRPRIFPRERLFCFRCRVDWVSNPLCAKATTEPPSPSSPTNSQPYIVLHAYLSQLPQIGGRGICSAQPTRCLRIKGRHLGCRHRIRTSSPGYEPGELPLLHHCDMIFVFSHFGIIIIPQFCLFVKIREYVEKEGTAVWDNF